MIALTQERQRLVTENLCLAPWLAKRFEYIWKSLGFDWEEAIAEMRFVICRCAGYHKEEVGSFSNFCTCCARRHLNNMLAHRIGQHMTNFDDVEIEADDRMQETELHDLAVDTLEAVFRIASKVEKEAGAAVLIAGTPTAAAKRLGISRQHLNNRLKRMGSRYLERFTTG
jgi:DNA-binding NtrC family response regulator